MKKNKKTKGSIDKNEICGINNKDYLFKSNSTLTTTNNKKEEQKVSNKAISKRTEDFSRWYLDVIAAADLAEHSVVRGCMTIKPYGYSIWENIQKILDKMLKELEVKNAYFPLFIPESFLKKESEHVKGFAPELAIVTHGGGKKLKEPLVVRPTSETIIYDSFSRWIHSYRDLPLLINQWANIVRWEMRPRLFLRTLEFLWQEGHTAHSSLEEANTFALKILNDVYKKFAEEYLAIPVYTGQKSEGEKFAGALKTFCIEALMQDGKSLQAGTSHNLSDNFAKPFNVSFLDQNEKKQFVYQTSWGVSTRLIGGLIMSHSDDKGLVLPPQIAPIQIVIIPINSNQEIENAINKIKEQLNSFSVHIDSRNELTPGIKYYEWEKKGVPVRIEIGPRDLKNNQCILVRRDTQEKIICPLDKINNEIKKVLDLIQKNLFHQALTRRNETNKTVDTWEEFKKAIDVGGYVFAYWCGDIDCENKIKEKTKAVSRCLPFEGNIEKEKHKCIHCGKEIIDQKRWIFAKAY